MKLLEHVTIAVILIAVVILLYDTFKNEKMNIHEYQLKSKRTFPTLGSQERDLLHTKLGVITEFGETLDVFKKNIAYGKPIDYVNLQEELCGDLMFYLVNEATLLNEQLYDVYPDDYPQQTQEFYLDQLMHTFLYYLNTDWPTIDIIKRILFISDGLGLDFFQGLENNINKLLIRYPLGFDSEKALNRNLEEERKELEK